MKARITFLVFGLLFCIAFSAQTQQHVHSNGHEAQLKKLIPNVPYIVYDQDSLSGYNEAAINSQAAQQQYSPDDTKRYQALMKRNFINTKYGVNAMAAAGSQNPPTVQAPCTNIDFEAGNTSGWTTSGDAAIMSGGGMDPYGNFPMVCPGGSFSLKLGNATNPTTSKASQTFAVTAANAYFVLRFAMVILNYPHVPSDAARVFIRFKDQSNNVIACPNFECYYAETSSGGGQSYGLTGFQTGANGVNIGNQSYPTTYVPWTTLGFDITPYIGQNITVEIENRWCVYNYDWAYCYVDGLCSNLTTSATGGCQGTNLLLSAPLGMDTYNWAGPAGSSVSTIHTQTVSTTVSGVYTVTCIPYSTCGSATYVYTINAVTSVPPTANFNYTVTPCSPTFSVPFSDNSLTNGGAAIASWNWNWGDGTANGTTQNPTHTYTSSGTKTVKLVVSNGACTDSITKTFNFSTGPAASFTTANVCNGNIANFGSTTTPTTGIAAQVWTFGDGSPNGMGSTAAHSYTNPGTYNVKLVVTSTGTCKDSITQPITIYPKPTVSFTTTPVCFGTATTFSNNSSVAAPATISNWAWDFDNNATVDNTTMAPSFNYTATGNYTAELKATTSNGCSDSTTMVIQVNPMPTVTFTPVDACVNYNVTLNNTSSVSPGSIATWQWAFGAGSNPSSTSTPNPSLTYSNSGVKTITLTAISNNSCTASFTNTVTINAQPTAAFVASAVCKGIATTFTDQSTPTAGNTNSITAWAWDYTHDGSVDNNTQNPTFTFGSSGTFTTALVVTSVNGCRDTVLVPVDVFGHASVNFTTSNACFGATTTFSDQTLTNAQANTGNLSTWNWNLGDGTTSNSSNPSYNYPNGTNANTTYTVKLVVTTSHGCSDSLSKPVTIYALPTAAFTSDSACFGSASHMFDASNGNGNTITGYAWDYNGDGVADASGVSNPNFSFPVYGNTSVNYTVTTTPSAGMSCKSFTTQNVWVNPLPVPAFSFTNVCINAQPMNYDATASSIPVGTNTLYAWGYGDGVTGTGTTTNHTYGLAGSYNVTLTLTSNKGCVKNLTQQVTVYQKPHVTFSSAKTCFGSPTTFNGSMLPGSGNVTQWLWDFNSSINTIEGNGQNPSFTFNSQGTQTISLISITDPAQGSCRDTITRQIYVNYVPHPQFTVDKPAGCPLPHCVIFTDNTPAIPAPAQVVTWIWRFGDGTSLTANSNSQQSHCYTNSSSSALAYYNVTLVAVSDSSCTDSLTKNNFITVYPKPVADYTVNPNPGTVTEPLEYFTNTSHDFTRWWWTFGDGSPIDTVNLNPTHFYNDASANTYGSSLLVMNQYGCTDTAFVLVEIGPEFVFYIPNAFSPNDDNVNDGFTGKGIGIAKYEMWIYDRWGMMIYYTDDINKPWNGKVQGKQNPVQQDVYVWKVKLIDIFGKKHDYIGHVTVLRGGGSN